ncbi:cytochrome P450 [Hyaloraphidium curvatum]|nr:cytochrome P450 [Hyaloraphidium curvatum]
MDAFTILLALVVAMCIAHVAKSLSSPLARVPGAFYSIFTGVPHLAFFLSGHHVPYIVQLSRRYGGLARIRPTELLVSDPALAEVVTVRLDLPKPSFIYKMMRMPFDDVDSVLTFENADKAAGLHRKRRRLVFPAFAPSTLERVERLVESHIRELLQRIALDIGDKGDHPVELVEVFEALTLDVILDLAFDMHPHTLLAPLQKSVADADPLSPPRIRRSVAQALQFAGLRAGLSLLGIPLGLISWIPYVKEGRVALERVQSFAERVVAIRRSAGPNATQRADLLQALVDSTDDDTGTKLTDREVVTEAALFLIAGNETTSAALAFASGFLISEGARAWKRLQAEVDAAWAKAREATGSDHYLDHAALRDLPYLNAVIVETLRLRPIAAFTARTCANDLVLTHGGTQYTVPANTLLTVSAPGLSTDIEFWGPDVDEFRPERFMPLEQGGRKDWLDPVAPDVRRRLAAFSFGSRNCIGSSLARMQMRLALANLILNFDCEGWSDGRLSEEHFLSYAGASYAATMKVAGGKLFGRFRPRKQA